MAVDQIKIVALNILSGGGSRVARLCAYLAAQQADVIVLTEWRKNDQGRDIATWARANALYCAGLADGGEKVNGVFVASKIAFTTHDVTPPRPRNDPMRAGAMMLVSAGTWTMLACYFPQGKGDKGKGINPPKPPFFASIAEWAAAYTGKPLLVIGDLNNGHRERDREGAKFVGPEDFEALSGIAGLVDLWRHSHGDDAREYSYVSSPRTSAGSGSGFRIDHAFANQAFLREMHPVCNYDHGTRRRVEGRYEITNHSALIVTGTHWAFDL